MALDRKMREKITFVEILRIRPNQKSSNRIFLFNFIEFQCMFNRNLEIKIFLPVRQL